MISRSTISLKMLSREEFSTNLDFQAALKSIYINAFSKAYKDYWTPEFETEFKQYCDSSLEESKSNPDMVLITIYLNNTVAGWALFHVKGSRAILRIICVDPAFQKKGLGKKLVFSIQAICPTIKTIIVFTYLINRDSPLFYESIGFIKTDLMLPEYVEFNMQGFEYTINKGPDCAPPLV